MAFDPCGDQLKIENWKTTNKQKTIKNKKTTKRRTVCAQTEIPRLCTKSLSAKFSLNTKRSTFTFVQPKICKKIVLLTWSWYKQVSKRITTTQMSDLDPRLLPVSWYEKSLGGACEIPNIHDILLWWISRQTTYSCHIKNIRAIRKYGTTITDWKSWPWDRSTTLLLESA